MYQSHSRAKLSDLPKKTLIAHQLSMIGHQETSSGHGKRSTGGQDNGTTRTQSSPSHNG